MKSLFSHSLVIGKCLPPHRGHHDLIVFAASMASRTTVLVEQRPDEAIPVATRCAWIRSALGNFPHVEVVALEGDHPQSPPMDSVGSNAFWSHWANLIHRYAGTVDAVVSGDDYGARLAADQGATWVPFDRTCVPISATTFKENPWGNWDWLIPAAQVALLRKVLLIGSESTGKSTLGKHLVKSVAPSTVLIPEYAEHWLRRNPSTTRDEIPWDLFLTGQSSSYEAWSSRANRWILEDSNALTTAVWAHMSGRPDVAERAMDHAATSPPHHVLLSVSDGVPWTVDTHRLSPDDRPKFDAEFRRRLDQLGWTYTELSGSYDSRSLKASTVLNRWLTKWREAPWSQWTCEPQSPPTSRVFRLSG